MNPSKTKNLLNWKILAAVAVVVVCVGVVVWQVYPSLTNPDAHRDQNFVGFTLTLMGPDGTENSMDTNALLAGINHPASSFTDSENNVWEGTTLWQWVFWCSQNSEETFQTYSVQIVAGDGAQTTFNYEQVNQNGNLILATELNGASLSAPYAPLTLVGDSNIRNIIKIQITPNYASPTSSPGTSSSASPTAEPTVSAPTATPTVTPTATTSPSNPPQTQNPTASPSPTPVATPTPSPTSSPSPTPEPTPTPTPILTVVGSDGTTQTFTMAQIEALTSVTGTGQYVNTFPKTNGPNSYIGVAMLTLCNMVGGVSPSHTVTTISRDGYTAKFTYDEVVNGQLETFNSAREDSQITSGQTVILSYKIDGEYWTSNSGPLRATVINTPADRYSDSTLWNKNVVRIEIS